MDADSLLVIIDMQPYFPTARNRRTNRAVAEEIKSSIEQGEPMLFVTGGTDWMPPEQTVTNRGLTRLTEGSPHEYAIHEFRDNGADEIVQFLTTHHFRDSKVRVCGVNTQRPVSARASPTSWQRLFP
jgi:hypothetical protein